MTNFLIEFLVKIKISGKEVFYIYFVCTNVFLSFLKPNSILCCISKVYVTILYVKILLHYKNEKWREDEVQKEYLYIFEIIVFFAISETYFNDLVLTLRKVRVYWSNGNFLLQRDLISIHPTPSLMSFVIFI